MGIHTSEQLATFERLIDVGSLLERRAEAQMREASGLTNTHYEILIRLRNAGGQLRMSDLANKLTHTPSGLTYQVRQLEKLGFAIRVPAPHDDRGVLAQITDAGRDFVRSQYAGRSALIEDVVVTQLTPSELLTLHALLGKMQLNLRGEMTGGMLPEMVDELDRVAALAEMATAANLAG